MWSLTVARFLGENLRIQNPQRRCYHVTQAPLTPSVRSDSIFKVCCPECSEPQKRFIRDCQVPSTHSTFNFQKSLFITECRLRTKHFAHRTDQIHLQGDLWKRPDLWRDFNR